MLRRTCFTARTPSAEVTAFLLDAIRVASSNDHCSDRLIHRLATTTGRPGIARSRRLNRTGCKQGQRQHDTRPDLDDRPTTTRKASGRAPYDGAGFAVQRPTASAPKERHVRGPKRHPDRRDTRTGETSGPENQPKSQHDTRPDLDDRPTTTRKASGRAPYDGAGFAVQRPTASAPKERHVRGPKRHPDRRDTRTGETPGPERTPGSEKHGSGKVTDGAGGARVRKTGGRRDGSLVGWSPGVPCRGGYGGRGVRRRSLPWAFLGRVWLVLRRLRL
ncbi:hypothetical protein BJ992_001819 [Sphaerisporangium rubeum]|uniref:Uncharacterized protein n=1 Tax=Sphaerisporangium rubeum TaxID=321317 RepID=A0A7X0ICA4_9ACTN|nr:hypothetical protein [Sphaerisporangium rubeum]